MVCDMFSVYFQSTDTAVVPEPLQQSSSQLDLVSGLVETSQAMIECASYPLSPTNAQIGYNHDQLLRKYV